jgi:hypothetical protein
VHNHSISARPGILIDGLFESDPLQGVRCIAAPALAAGDAETLQAKVRRRILRAFQRRGILEKYERMEMELWEHGGGFSLDARVRIAANERHDAHRLIYHLPKPGPDGRTQLILSPLQLLKRIAALVPPPRQHRHRYYGVLVPNAPLRAALTALGPETITTPPSASAKSEPADTPHRSPARYLRAPAWPSVVHWVKSAGSWQENPLAWRPPTPGTAPRSPASCPGRRSAGP